MKSGLSFQCFWIWSNLALLYHTTCEASGGKLASLRFARPHPYVRFARPHPTWRSDPRLRPQTASDRLRYWNGLKWGRWSMKKWSFFKLGKITILLFLASEVVSEVSFPKAQKYRSFRYFWALGNDTSFWRYFENTFHHSNLQSLHCLGIKLWTPIRFLITMCTYLQNTLKTNGGRKNTL